MTNQPTGTVTLLFTDIVGSTRLAQQQPDTWRQLQERHHAILRSAIDAHNGYVFQIIGDAFCAAFATAGEALRASIKAQIDLHAEDWGPAPIKVRMGLHTGQAELQPTGGYIGYLTLSHVQRLMSVAHGGQVLISATTQALVRDALPEEISLRDLGERRLKDLARPEHIFQLLIPTLPGDFALLKTPEVFPTNLPVQLTSFVGREKELTEVKKLLHDAHLLTLIGSGGTGKTRLSIQAAGELLDQYPDGVWLVEFAPILDPLLVPRTTAMAIGLREESMRPVIDLLCDYVREKKMLIILDNCEHLVEACAHLADRLLHASAHTRLLASSREALGIAGEVTYHVPSLRSPDLDHLPSVDTLNQYEAVKLFIDRAISAVPTFTVTSDNAPFLAQICHRLDVIPLAIELAAAKIRVLSVEQIARRLDDRFRLLTGGSRTALERHQTLRATLDWSYNLLPPAEQILLRRL
ncbi:MAG TPA: adenylate/guanylate cyclase domain-containing protein, partial [Anaerolineae bacterium]|nr:adenylate/guanylate cyclase domain-containing protein [Anaerolineae bacterium]